MFRGEKAEYTYLGIFIQKGTESRDFYYLREEGQCPEILDCVM
jgi:hypothetical protein